MKTRTDSRHISIGKVPVEDVEPVGMTDNKNLSLSDGNNVDIDSEMALLWEFD